MYFVKSLPIIFQGLVKKMLDIEPRNRPTAAQVCLHPWMKSSPSISNTPSKVNVKKASTENTHEKLTSTDVKVITVNKSLTFITRM